MKALYPGTFDPITKGHLDIIQRAVMMFDEVIVAISDHGRKQTMFSLEERCLMVKEVTRDMPTVHVVGFTNLAVEAAAEHKTGAIIRGLRMISDFEYEFTMAKFMADQNPAVQPVYVMADSKYAHLSSSAVRELIVMQSDISHYVPACILDMIPHQKKEAAALV